jgi:transposase
MNSTVIHQIATLFRGGASLRRIAQSLRISRRTVRKALAQLDAARTAGSLEGLPRPAAARGSQLDAYEPAILDLLARHPDITARRIYEELRQIGYTGGYTILSERVRQLRPRPVVPPVRRFETAPGVQAQMDYDTPHSRPPQSHATWRGCSPSLRCGLRRLASFGWGVDLASASGGDQWLQTSSSFNTLNRTSVRRRRHL